MRTVIPLFLSLFLLAACGGDQQTVVFSDDNSASVHYSYPYDGQSEVPVHAPLVVRFSHALTTADPADEVTLETEAGDAVPFTAQLVADGRSLVITPDEPLTPATDYVLELGDQQTGKGAPQLPGAPLEFSTRLTLAGPVEQMRTDTDFRVARMIPDGQVLPLMDFSSLRLQMTQPVVRASVDYGSTIRLEDDAGQLVDANVLAAGPYITVDPVTDLNPGDSYHLRLTTGLKSTLGMDLIPGDYSDQVIAPKNSRPRDTLVQRAGVSNDMVAQQCGPDTTGDRLSPLTGMPINCVPINAVLLGEDSSSQQQGNVYAELAFVPNFPETSPLRVPRGSLLQGASVDVNIAGVVPAGFETGDISVKFVSDASGYMLANPYTDDPAAPRRIRLYMDVAMNTANAEANGALSQDLLHLELVGTAIVENGVLTIDAVGVVEPRVLGVENAYGTLSFHMEGYPDQQAAPPMDVDMDPPALQSWVPGDDGAGDVRPGDPIILNFTEPLDRNSLAESGAVLLQKDGMSEAFDWYLDGATLVIKPDEPLAYGSDYLLDLNSQVTDLAGNPLDQNYSLTFTMPHYVGTDHRAPLAITTYPGYPCVTDPATRDLGGDIAGRCAGGLASDDRLPVMDLPANRPIEVQFSQTMDPDSIALGGSFLVERNSAQDGSGTWTSVPGHLVVKERLVRFHPETPWQDGELYRYTLGSNGDGQSGAAICDGSDAICSLLPNGSTGFPLQTSTLEQEPADAPIATGGGPDMEIFFRGAPQTASVLQTLRNLPSTDVNANMIYDGRQPADDESGCTPATCEALPAPDGSGGYVVEENATQIVATGAGGLATDAKVGCPFAETCPEKKFIWLTGGLNAEVVGAGTYPGTGESAVRVNVFPTLLMTSNLDVYVNIGTAVHNPSGPQIMRMRYDNSGPEPKPITGWILDTPQGPVFETELDLYLDAPYLEPTLSLPHNLHSYEASMTLRGPVTFLEDGRMQIQQLNVSAVPIQVSIASGGITVDLEIPAEGAFLNFLPTPLKD